MVPFEMEQVSMEAPAAIVVGDDNDRFKGLPATFMVSRLLFDINQNMWFWLSDPSIAHSASTYFTFYASSKSLFTKHWTHIAWHTTFTVVQISTYVSRLVFKLLHVTVLFITTIHLVGAFVEGLSWTYLSIHAQKRDFKLGNSFLV
jgi:hypothetical protein